MELIYIYILFAVTTGIWSAYELFSPILAELSITNPEDILVKNKWLTMVTMAGLAALFAPIFIGLVMTPGMSEAFKDTLIKQVSEQPEKI